MSLWQNIRNIVANNQILVVLFAMIGGFVLPGLFQPLAPFSTPLLMLIFFTASLRLGLNEVLSYARDWRMLGLSTSVMLLFMPLAMWLPCYLFAPDWALPFLIIGAMPTGLTVALIADLFGGKISLAMLVSAATSLLAPITVPLVFWIILGHTIAIPVLKLFGSLVLTIVLPFLAAVYAKHSARRLIERHDLFLREASLVLFGLLIAGIVADTVRGTTIHLGWNEIGIVTVMMIFMGGIAWFAYAITAWRTPAERITIALCMVYMNNTLALYIGDRFFHEQQVVPKLLVILTAVNALLPLIKWAAGRVIQKQKISLIAQPVV